VSILPQSLAAALGRFADAVLPGSCLLCGADAGAGLICPDCTADLPPAPAPACPQCGEATTHGERCGACLKDPPAFARTVALFRYEFPVDRIIHALKYAHRLPVAAWLGERLAERLADAPPDLVVPLPLHPARLRERGFNQSAEIARTLAHWVGRPLDVHNVVRTRPTPPQAGLPLKERGGNVRGAFECRTDFGGRSVLLVDDVMTSGATLRECARILRLHGAGEITVTVAARALRH
jgi:ComF family protein